ncbi:MAG TPA: hypothetical protein VK629_05980 [Steroidobacteraceae bacterium]|nr:hypothetical protein [Steroidobacteraceae bacterium]
MFDADLFQLKRRKCFEAFPALLDAVPPVTLEPVSGSFSLSAEKEWLKIEQQVQRGEFKLRAQLPTTESLVGPFVNSGYCLDPLTKPGMQTWIDPTMAAQDGDLVIAELTENTARAMVERNKGNPRFKESYGDTPGPFVTKILRKCGCHYYLATNDGMFSINGHAEIGFEPSRILGVVRHLRREGVQVYADAPGVSCISPNAATEVFEDSDAGPTNVSPLTPTNVLQVTFTASSDGVVQATYTGNVSTSTTETGEPMFLQVIADPRAATADVPTDVVFDSTPVRLALAASLEVFEGENVEVYLFVAAITPTMTLSDSRLRVEFIKR